jgi:pfkB family carbohydrate kinase
MELAGRPPSGDAARASSRASARSFDSGSFDYVTVGHVTVDVIASDSSRRPGGAAFYSALQAARLGLRALIVTQGSPPEIEALLAPYRDELELRIIPAPATTTFETSWTGGRRSQRVLAWAGPLAGPIEVDTRILHFAPVARETPAAGFDAHPPHAGFIGLTPQGLARTWDEDGVREIVLAPLPSDRRSLDDLLPDGLSAVVVSEHERAACAPLLAAAAATGAVLAVTAGPGATSVELPSGEITQVQAPAVAAPRDDLGAGDVFAAAFFVALREGLSPAGAATFANAAAAIRIEGLGADAIGDRRAIEARLP